MPHKIKISNASGLIIGRKYIEFSGMIYKVGEIIEKMRFYITDNEYFEGDVKLKSTNVKKQTASFVGVSTLAHKENTHG